jgi:HEAT repeat protein
MKTQVAIAIVVVTIAGCSLAGQQADIRTFVRQIYFEGVPYEEATSFDSASAVPVLLNMLADSKEEEYWPNVVITLGMLGDERAVAPLIRFLEQDGSGNPLSRPHYVAKTGVPMALGYLINKRRSQAALAYLKDSVRPGIWRERKLSWASPHHPNEDDRNLQLSKMAILGLALSADPSAAETLRSLQKPAINDDEKRLQARYKDVIVEALNEHRIIATEGLAKYDRRRRGSK